jgi:hypothetical protein
MRVFVGLHRATRLLRPQEQKSHAEADAAVMDVSHLSCLNLQVVRRSVEG